MEKTGETLDTKDIEYDFDLLKETEDLAYFKSYVYYDKSYRIAISSIDKKTKEVKIVKIY